MHIHVSLGKCSWLCTVTTKSLMKTQTNVEGETFKNKFPITREYSLPDTAPGPSCLMSSWGGGATNPRPRPHRAFWRMVSLACTSHPSWPRIHPWLDTPWCNQGDWLLVYSCAGLCDLIDTCLWFQCSLMLIFPRSRLLCNLCRYLLQTHILLIEFHCTVTFCNKYWAHCFVHDDDDNSPVI